MMSKLRFRHWFMWQRSVYALSSIPRNLKRAATGANGVSTSFCTTSLLMKLRLKIAHHLESVAVMGRVCHREDVRKCLVPSA